MSSQGYEAWQGQGQGLAGRPPPPPGLWPRPGPPLALPTRNMSAKRGRVQMKPRNPCRGQPGLHQGWGTWTRHQNLGAPMTWTSLAATLDPASLVGERIKPLAEERSPPDLGRSHCSAPVPPPGELSTRGWLGPVQGTGEEEALSSHPVAVLTAAHWIPA